MDERLKKLTSDGIPGSSGERRVGPQRSTPPGAGVFAPVGRHQRSRSHAQRKASDPGILGVRCLCGRLGAGSAPRAERRTSDRIRRSHGRPSRARQAGGRDGQRSLSSRVPQAPDIRARPRTRRGRSRSNRCTETPRSVDECGSLFSSRPRRSRSAFAWRRSCCRRRATPNRGCHERIMIRCPETGNEDSAGSDLLRSTEGLGSNCTRRGRSSKAASQTL